jgi:hypothetical protein
MFFRRWWFAIWRILAAIAVAVGLLCAGALTNGGIGRSDTGTGTEGLMPGSVQCIGRSGYTPEVDLSGMLTSLRGEILTVSSTEAATLEPPAVRVWIDNVEQTAIGATDRPAYLQAPVSFVTLPWDGVDGHQRMLSVKVTNPMPSSEVTFSLTSSLIAKPRTVAIGRALEPDCTPKPA